MINWEQKFEAKITEVATADDPAHDLNHFHRVVALAKKLCAQEKAIVEVVIPAAWLHDLVIVSKNSPLRSQASRLSAEKALEFLREINYPEKFHADIAHAIEAHSFSANIETKTLEAKIVQDVDPFFEHRAPDDQKFTIDHFYQKLFKTVETLKNEIA